MTKHITLDLHYKLAYYVVVITYLCQTISTKPTNYH